MAFDNTVTIIGNVVRDPELRHSQAGNPRTTLAIAWNRKRQGQEDETSFFDVICFRELAENVAETARKGMRVAVYGSLQQRNWLSPEGDRRSKLEILADDVMVSLRRATAEVTKNAPRDGGGRDSGTRQRRQPQQTQSDEPY